MYHLLDRGDHQEAIFRDDADRRFLSTLEEGCERTGWRVHAFVLMSNHYHLLVETPQANLISGMRWFQTTYMVRYNRRHAAEWTSVPRAVQGGGRRSGGVEAVGSNWDLRELLGRATPELRRTLEEPTVAMQFEGLEMLGKGVTILDVRGASENRVGTAGTRASAVYDVDAQLEDGAARFSIGLALAGGQWRVSTFAVHRSRDDKVH